MGLKMNFFRLALTVIVTINFSMASAQIAEPILGISLGGQVSFDKCDVSQGKNWSQVSFSTPDFLALNPPDHLGPNALPTWVRQERIYIRPSKDGLIEAFSVNTFGPSVQDRVLKSISGRFGEPTSLRKRMAQTATGATFEVAYAQWVTADAVVVHVCSRMDQCNVRFLTLTGWTAQEAEWQQRLKRDKL